MLEHGPGAGWRDLLEGGTGLEPGRDGKGLEMRAGDFKLWRETWIAPAFGRLVDRYWRPTRRARALAPPVPSTLVARLRDTLREGEARQARADRGGEDPPYWAGYYHAIARQAIERLEELEAAEARRS